MGKLSFVGYIWKRKNKYTIYANMSIAKDISLRHSCKCFSFVIEIAAESCPVSFSQLSLEVAPRRF